MAIPLKDSLLLPWTGNFKTRIVATPTAFGLTAAQATAYTAVSDPFVTAYNAMMAAREAGVRSGPLTATKDATKFDLLRYGRELYAQIQDSLSVTDAQKIELGIKVRASSPTPIPAPADAPEVTAVSVFGHNVRLHIVDASHTRKGRPIGVAGASLFSFVGPVPPSGTAGWQAEGNVTRNNIVITFPDTVAPGTKVWFTAFWYSQRGLNGPACTPVSSGIGYEGAMPVAV